MNTTTTKKPRTSKKPKTSEVIKTPEAKTPGVKTPEAKTLAPKVRRGGMKIRVGTEEFPSLNQALRVMEPVLWAEENDYRRGCWTRINRNLKKSGSHIELNHIFQLIDPAEDAILSGTAQ